MRFSLRMKFALLMMPFIVAIGLLMFFLLRPFYFIKIHVRDVQHDIVQVSSAEKFSRSLYKQHNELALVILNGSTAGLEKKMDAYRAERADIINLWIEALESAFFDEEDEKRNMLQNFRDIQKRSHQIQEYAVKAAQALTIGDQLTAISFMHLIDSLIEAEIAPKINKSNSALVSEVTLDLPLTVQVLRQISLWPMLDIDRDIDKLKEEFSNGLVFSKISRLVNEHHQRIEGLLISSDAKLRLNMSAHEELKKLIASLTKKGTGAESDRQEHASERTSTSKMIKLAEALDSVSKETVKYKSSGAERGKAVKIMTDMARIEDLFNKEIEGLIFREESEIKETSARVVRRIDSVYTVVIFISALILAIGSLGAFALYRSIVSPVLRLRNAALRISEGNFETAVFSDSSDEMGELSITFDTMRQDLRSALEKLNREIMTRKQTELEKEKIIQDLRRVLAEVKTLSGLLPICSSCKKVRDDKGYWTQVELYVSERSQAEFSHGYCPDCAAKVMEEIKRLKSST